MSLFSFLFGLRPKSPPATKQPPKPKQFKIRAEDIVSLIPPGGACMASDHITVKGHPVGFMYRKSPNHPADSGWIFMSGRESQKYADDPDNWAIYELNGAYTLDAGRHNLWRVMRTATPPVAVFLS